jgi:probable addiction module antidote protein
MHAIPLPAPASFLPVGCIQERDGDSLVFAKALVDIYPAKEITQITCETGLMHETLHKALPDDRNPSVYTISRVISALGLKLNTFVKNDEIVEDMAQVE